MTKFKNFLGHGEYPNQKFENFSWACGNPIYRLWFYYGIYFRLDDILLLNLVSHHYSSLYVKLCVIEVKNFTSHILNYRFRTHLEHTFLSGLITENSKSQGYLDITTKILFFFDSSLKWTVNWGESGRRDWVNFTICE